jgi:hypothetical protein
LKQSPRRRSSTATLPPEASVPSSPRRAFVKNPTPRAIAIAGIHQ